MTDKEIKTLEQSAQKGDKKAVAQLNDLGVDYQFGNNGQKVDLAQALHYYMIAAEGGNTNAMCNAAYCYATGVAGKVDAGKAFGLYQKAAEAADPRNCSNPFSRSTTAFSSSSKYSKHSTSLAPSTRVLSCSSSSLISAFLKLI